MSRRPSSTGQRLPSTAGSPRVSSLLAIGDMAVIALLLCRLFVPAEGVEQGNTLWIACSWLALGAVRLWMQARTGAGLPVSLSIADYGLALLIGGQLLSAACVILGTGDKRAALNSVWEWVALGVTWFLLKGVIQRIPAQKLLTSLLLVSVVTLSLLGVWQHFIWYPQQSRELTELFRLYDAQSAGKTLTASEQAEFKTLRAQWGSDVLMMEEGGRQMLLARTRDSREPIGRFALANTFAALLILGWYLSADLLRQQILSRRDRLTLACALISFGLVTTCLLLTKSRTAVVGLTLSIGLLILRFGLQPGPHRKAFLRWVGGGIAAVVLLGIAVTLIGGLDVEVLSEAPKSLEYRMEYWRATAKMIADHPIWGVGPGNFRQHYYAYKLPGASEEILDPHNMVLESWATGGILSFAGLLVLILPWGIRSWLRAMPQNSSASQHEIPDSTGPNLFLSAVVTGAGTFLLILAVEWLLEGFFDRTLVWVGLGWMAVLILGFGRVVSGDQFSSAGALAAATAILIHLLGAGGFGMPAVLQLILMLILMTTLPRTASFTIPPYGVLAASLLMTGLFFASLKSGLIPVLSTQSLIERARQDWMANVRSNGALNHLMQATQSDPLSAAPYRDLSQMYFTQWKNEFKDDPDSFQLGLEALQQGLARDPRSPKDYLSLSEWWLLRHERTKTPEFATASLDAARHAATLYPNDSRMQTQVALSARAAGDLTTAKEAATTAIHLDDMNRQRGHLDKYLSPFQREQLEAILSR